VWGFFFLFIPKIYNRKNNIYDVFYGFYAEGFDLMNGIKALMRIQKFRVKRGRVDEWLIGILEGFFMPSVRLHLVCGFFM
jgi:hypothetical protein